ncbi:hypothetical protein D1839_14690 [Roseburia sp. 1XD42-34]|nr:hypothetical protein [Roseburia sp. 1XD42-34]RKI76823.1 hypothetical protein D7V87_12350 [Clostridium sp. 1xD42-85]
MDPELKKSTYSFIVKGSKKQPQPPAPTISGQIKAAELEVIELKSKVEFSDLLNGIKMTRTLYVFVIFIEDFS